MRLEPKNAFFILIHAGAKMAGQEEFVGLRDFLDAAQAPYFNDYVLQERATLQAAVVENAGDIDPTSILRIRSQVLLPHYAFITGLTRRAITGSKSSDQYLQAAAKIADKLMRSHELAITSLVGASVFRIAYPLKSQATGEINPVQRRSAATTDTLAHWSAFTTDFQSDAEHVAEWRPNLSASALAMLLLSFPIALVIGVGASRKANRRQAQPVTPVVPGVILAALLLAVGIVVTSATLPVANLIPVIFATAVVASSIGYVLVPPSRVSSLVLGGIATAACLAVYVAGLTVDVRAQGRASDLIDRQETFEAAVTQAGM
jgi:hypothetical protein